MSEVEQTEVKPAENLENSASEPTVTVDDIAHKVSDLSPEIQQLLAVHQEWKADAETATADANTQIANANKLVSQLNAANEHLIQEIVTRIRNETGTAPAAPSAPATDATGTPNA